MPAGALSGSARRLRGGCIAALFTIAALALSACGTSGTPGQLLVAPGYYDAYRCNDLAKAWGDLNRREAELVANMNRASQVAAGTIIGDVAYGPDYQTVLTQKKMVQQQAAAKNCELVRGYQSDQTVR